MIALTIVIGVGVLAFAVARVNSKSEHAAPTSGTSSSPAGAMLQEQASSRNTAHRNLSLQPEAFNMARRLGKRFSASKRERSLLEGIVTIGTEQLHVQTVRLQTDDGEKVEIAVAGKPGKLTWEPAQGARVGADRAEGRDRELVERLVIDSPDQFVMAQLRGASYSSIARNVRPAEAVESYSGPLWNIVRVGEPERDSETSPQSSWRLYYINTRTGLIDRIVSELRGETIAAEISGWTAVDSEMVPGQITWSSNGRQIMQYRLTTFSRGQQ